MGLKPSLNEFLKKKNKNKRCQYLLKMGNFNYGPRNKRDMNSKINIFNI